MKLLLENWRKYLAESEKADSYGHLYLFEDDNVTKTFTISFWYFDRFWWKRMKVRCIDIRSMLD